MFEGEGKTILDIEEISNCSFHVIQEVIISLIATCIRLHFLLQYSLFVVFLLLLIGSSRDGTHHSVHDSAFPVMFI